MSDRRIKVCHIIAKMVYGGASLYTLQLVNSLNQGHFRATIVFGGQSSDEGNLLKSENNKAFESILMPEMVREISPIKDLITFIKLIKILRRDRYDIIHTHGSKAGIIGRTAAAFCRAPVILYTVHGWGLKTGGSFFRILYRLTERIVASFTTKLLFLTESDMKEAASYKIGKSSQYNLIRTGINLVPFFNYDKDMAGRINRELGLRGRKTIGSVGRVSFQKNPVEFIRIAAEVIKKRDDVKFIYVGGGELLNQMRDLVKKQDLEDRVIFTGVRQCVPEVVANFDIFILPSLWEGMPLSVIEAMAVKKPIVTYNVSGIEELVQNGINGYVVPVNQTHEFAERIEFLLNNPEIGAKMAENGRATAAKFDYMKVVSKIESLYGGLIHKYPWVDRE